MTSVKSTRWTILLILVSTICSSSGARAGQARHIGAIVGRAADRIVLSVARPPEKDRQTRLLVSTIVSALEYSHVFRLLPYKGKIIDAPVFASGKMVPSEASFLLCPAIVYNHGRRDAQAYIYAAGKEKALLARAYTLPDNADELFVENTARSLSDWIVKGLTGRSGFASTRVAFVADYNGRSAVFTAFPDGRHPERVISGSFDCLFPRYAFDRNWIVYTAYPRGFPELYVKDLVSGRNHRLSGRAGLNTLGALSPEGCSVAATLSFQGNPDIYLLSLTGAVKKRLTTDRACDLSPCWSPDGSRIAFVSDRSGSPHIYEMPADAARPPRRLTHSFDGCTYCTSPSWSPDGTKIVFSGRNEGRFHLFVISLEDGSVTRITKGDSNEESPAWACDSRHVVAAVSGRRGGGLDVIDTFNPSDRFTINLEGLSRVRSPTWQRDVRR